MQAYIKDNKLIINTMINDYDKSDLLEFINKSKYKKIIPEDLYDIGGNISGIAFKLE